MLALKIVVGGTETSTTTLNATYILVRDITQAESNCVQVEWIVGEGQVFCVALHESNLQPGHDGAANQMFGVAVQIRLKTKMKKMQMVTYHVQIFATV